MRNAIRLIPLGFVVLALLAAGPLAAAPGAEQAVGARLLAGQDTSPGSWLQGLLAWLGVVPAGAEHDAAPVASILPGSGNPGGGAGSEPDPEITPQDGPFIDPNG
ncbi:MAG TPA: hypothetical protein VJG13_00665 [Thermoanaerobaculia bacterium]|jgi:hypothetical protein|nr:hypothetical protein [Thermoanaerobaculia bacterium]